VDLRISAVMDPGRGVTWLVTSRIGTAGSGEGVQSLGMLLSVGMGRELRTSCSPGVGKYGVLIAAWFHSLSAMKALWTHTQMGAGMCELRKVMYQSPTMSKGEMRPTLSCSSTPVSVRRRWQLYGFIDQESGRL
jgi:hypothetical protein